MGQSKDLANVEEIPAEVNQRIERKNAVHFKHRKAKGKDNGSSPENNQAQGKSIDWAHRTILRQTARSVQQ